MRLFLLSALLLAAVPAAVLVAGDVASQPPPPLRLAWPVACQVGVDCEIQHYVDHDPSPATKDYACGTLTYDAHDGVDIRLPDMAAQRRGVQVLAAADGRVQAVRDGMADVSVRITGLDAVKGMQCGNRVAIMHAGGFLTDYCHMAKGSVLVKPGDLVKAGTPLGRIGLSGETEFPHLHFSVRQNNQVVDPFAYGAPEGTCSGGRSLWAQTPAYRARVIVNAGFTGAPPTLEAVENGEVRPAAAGAATLLAYVRVIGLKVGDVQTLVLRAPGGAVLAQSKAAPLDRNQDLRLMYIGGRKPAQGWPSGRYTADYSVTDRDGRVAIARTLDLAL